MADESKKCAHELCTCMTDGKSKYCSTFCEDAKGTQTLKCDCGHPGVAARCKKPPGSFLNVAGPIAGGHPAANSLLGTLCAQQTGL